MVAQESSDKMDEKSAKEVFNSTQDCLRLLNSMLTKTERSVSKAEYEQLRLATANAMASIIDICEFHIYADHPDLRPYTVDRKQD